MPQPMNDSSDESVDEESFKDFLSKIKTQQKPKKKRKEERTEQSATVSEYNVTKVQEPINLEQLLESLTDTRQQTAVKQQLTAIKSAKKALPAPLPKFQADKVKRTVGYENVKNELQKWQSVVEDFRTSDNLVFPLKKPSVNFYSAKAAVKNYKPMSDLEREVYGILERTGYAEEDDPEETEAAMDLEEALQRKNDIARLRARQSYYTAKARWQKKIKSKRYHNIKKKEKLRRTASEAESQMTTNPEAAVEKLKRLEELRVLERVSLRHKNTTKWAKFQITQIKHDKKSKDALQEQLELGRQLTRKIRPVVTSKSESEDSDSDDDSTGTPDVPHKVHFVDHLFKDIENFISPSAYDTLPATNTDNKQKKGILKMPSTKGNTKLKKQIVDEDATAGLKINTTDMMDVSTKRKRDMVDFNSSTDVHDSTEDVPNTTQDASNPRKKAKEGVTPLSNGSSKTQGKVGKKSKKHEEPELDPRKFINIDEKILRSRVPRLTNTGDGLMEDSSDEEESLRLTIAEAFAEDDVVAEFEEAKKDEVDSEKVKDINLVLPGWGSWGGPSIPIPKHKKEKFIIKAPTGPPRKDYKLGHMVISERKDKKLSAHKVKELPWQFVSVPAFENSISAPVGRNWNPETAFRKLVEPKVITKMGTIIEPMDAEALVNKVKPSLKKLEEKALQLKGKPLQRKLEPANNLKKSKRKHK